jgi:hypothetical protein
LAVENTILVIHGQKLSASVLINQRLKPSAFLILKKDAATAAGARSQSASDGERAAKNFF